MLLTLFLGNLKLPEININQKTKNDAVTTEEVKPIISRLETVVKTRKEKARKIRLSSLILKKYLDIKMQNRN